jgi:drug/metabolite transporter (DMT)-like permease
VAAQEHDGRRLAKIPAAPHDAGALAPTVIGCGAILLWASLAPLTVLKGNLPPFQTTAITFAIGGLCIALAAIVRGRARDIRPTGPSLLLGIYGLFVYHSIYFAALGLAPAAEAHLVNSLWALFIVLFSALLPGHRLSLQHALGASLGLGAAALLVVQKLSGIPAGTGAQAGFLLAFLAALVWSSYSVASRLVAGVPSESLAVPALLTSLLAAITSAVFETWTPPADATAWAALVAMGLGPVGGAFLLWDIGMKRGRVATLGVLSYASPVLSTLLLVAAGLSQSSLALWAACAMMTVAGVLATR